MTELSLKVLKKCTGTDQPAHVPSGQDMLILSNEYTDLIFKGVCLQF